MFNDKELIKQIKDLRTGSPDFEFDTSTQQIIAAVRVHDKLADEAETGALLFKRLRAQLAAAQKRIEELEKGVAQVWLTRTLDNIHLWTEPQEWDDEYDEFSGDPENRMYLGEFDVPGLAHQQCRSARIVLAPENRSTK